MSWSILLTLVLVLGIALFATWSRRAELRRMAAALREREDAAHVGADRARLQHPVIDLSRCLGCGTCVDACPEQGVLELVHGQATVINGARCVGTAVCERECPVGAITVTLTNLETRTDVPVLSDGLEAMGAPGLFLAGEVTAHALIKTAVEHGTAVGAEVARRCAGRPTPGDGHHDLLIVGAGPAGLACALEAMRHGLRTLVLEQEAELGGTVAKYPRRKLVVTLPVDMPLHGRLKSRTYEKEELMAIWQQIATEHEVPIRHGEVFTGLERQAEGGFVVQTRTGTHRARHVCIAIGRRGVPVRLGVPGEELPKVAYSLLDAHSYQGRRILVVGGGDSAIECALALAGQPGNEITLSYRRERLFRARARNLERLEACIADGRIEVLYNSEVLGIEPDAVELGIHEGGVVRTLRLDNDDVFVMAGGVPPFELLERSGVSFDPSLRPAPAPVAERGTGLLRGLAAGFALALAALGWAFLHSDYYARPLAERATHAKHQWLRPSEGLGLLLGIAAIALIVVNLLYLVRRSPTLRFTLGSLQAWMSSHIATGILALLCALLHGAMSPRDT
ncbi:MAG: NAD(P)-binding domain-containing protein, partial [Planctomycetes bacterium]|nr:NAD(P)-binding domain-containing protein [Planctomycetota bacterium]